MKKIWNFSFKFSFITGFMLIIDFIFWLVSNGNLSDNSAWNVIVNNSSYQMWTSINTVTGLMFSALVPIVVMAITLEINAYINRINNIETKKINYRNMNKQNSEVILREVKQFYEAICYICNLRKIEYNLDIELFEFEYNEIVSEEVRFLTKLKEDFFYDDLTSGIIESCINNQDNLGEFINSGLDLYNLFYGFDESSMKNIDKVDIERKVLEAFYAKCFWEPLFKGQYVKERATLYLKDNYLMHKRKKSYVDDVIENVIINKHNLDIIQLFDPNDSEYLKVINSNEFIKLAAIYLEEEVESVDQVTILNLLYIFKDLYDWEEDCPITCETLGENNKENVEYFVNNFKLDRISDEHQINYAIDNLKIHRYI